MDPEPPTSCGLGGLTKKIDYGTVEDDFDAQLVIAKRREEIFEKHLNNDPDAEPIPWYYSLYGLGGTLLGMVAVTLGFILWPTDDSIINPHSW